MVELNDYINEDNVEKDQLYESIKETIFCPICRNIMIKPVMCMNCQNNYCRSCINRWSYIKDYCPNKCKNAEYKNSLVISNILSKLNFKCKDCLTIINYEKMEKHVLSKCDSIDIKYDLNKNKVLSQGISKKFKRSDVIAEKFYEKSPTKIKSNSNQFNFNLIIIIIIVICLGSSEVGKTSLLKR